MLRPWLQVPSNCIAPTKHVEKILGSAFLENLKTGALQALDRMLWLMAPQDFVAHCHADADEELVQASPVLLAQDARLAPHHEVLLNLNAEVPEGFGRFDRLVEVVSAQDETDRAQARARWRHYASRGYAITRHDLVLKAG